MPPIHGSCWYAANKWNTAPLITLFCSLCAIGLLALIIKNDTEGTLLAVCPIEFSILADERVPAPVGRWRRRRAAIGEAVLHIILMVPWCCRSLLMPVLGGIGTAAAFEKTNISQEIVLNAVAIGFVYELDEFLYHNVLDIGRRQRWENSSHMPTSAVINARSRVAVAAYSWVCFLLDFSCATYYYLLFAVRTYDWNSCTPVPDAIAVQSAHLILGPPPPSPGRQEHLDNAHQGWQQHDYTVLRPCELQN